MIGGLPIKRLALGALLLSVVYVSAKEPLPLPASDFAPGWQAVETRTFTRQNLYGHIDGGAELFLEFGFSDLQVRKYVRDRVEIDLERYRMEDADAALGIYLQKCGRETPVAGLECRHSGDRYQITALKGQYLFIVNNFSGRAEQLANMVLLLQKASAEVAPAAPCALFKRLPGQQLKTDSLRLIRGQYAMQSQITLGEGDILQLDGKIYAVAGDYRAADGEEWSALAVQYPDSAKAAGVFASVCSHLDPYLKPQKKDNQQLIFFDGKRYGVLRLAGERIDLQFNLKSMPD